MYLGNNEQKFVPGEIYTTSLGLSKKRANNGSFHHILSIRLDSDVQTTTMPINISVLNEDVKLVGIKLIKNAVVPGNWTSIEANSNMDFNNANGNTSGGDEITVCYLSQKGLIDNLVENLEIEMVAGDSLSVIDGWNQQIEPDMTNPANQSINDTATRLTASVAGMANVRGSH